MILNLTLDQQKYLLITIVLVFIGLFILNYRALKKIIANYQAVNPTAGTKLHIKSQIPLNGNKEEIIKQNNDKLIEKFESNPDFRLNKRLNDHVEGNANSELANIHVILLDRDAKRKYHVHKNIRDYNLSSAKIFHAVDGQNLTNKNIEYLIDKNYFTAYATKKLRRGQIACAMSHIMLWEEMINKNIDRMMILEDDFDMQPYFKEKFQQIITKVPEDYDIFYMFMNKCCLKGEPLPNNPEVIKPKYPIGLVGYCITREGAEKILQYLKPLSTTIDTLLARLIETDQTDIKAYGLLDNLVLHKYQYQSNIWPSKKM